MIDLKHKLEGLKSVDAENKKLNVILVEKEKELEKIKNIVKVERDEKMDILQVFLLENLFRKNCIKKTERKEKSKFLFYFILFCIGQREKCPRKRTTKYRASKRD